MQRRRFLAPLAGATVLAGCGFKLRQAPTFAFNSLYISAPVTSPLAVELQRNMDAAGTVEVHRDAMRQAAGEAIFELISEQRESVVVGLNASGQVRELQLRLRVRFRLHTPDGRELLPSTEVLQYREVSYSETLALAKEAEQELLYRNMQTDIVRQIMRRLAAVKSL
ncbi:LPS assembly lipoprotein LptE [Ramlibacter sp. H39-3-26]|uniref:LPS-assembly lipoprotein LptE n=1 Tax=Curvibacter soli TaxID=3031331 RepID=UPI0023DB2E89|nr:LPS assembly lipoprotein LptE [Ramlibacter sp. H39-3-26]MDF1485962.1 LPS assembly lipoprotein LptE [Ramlibacter sp. H39-3-26]